MFIDYINTLCRILTKNNIMKIAIYLSGITGSFLLLIGTIGIIMEFPLNKLFLTLGLFLLVLVYFLLIIIDKYLHNKKIDKIIDSYKEIDKKHIQHEKRESKTKGSGMNNFPFREHKSGLTWGGGNIHGANASRGTSKHFLNR